jgi:hypothetical protein
MKRVSAALLAALFIAASPAQASDQVWTAVVVSGPVAKNSRFLVWFDGQVREHDPGSDTDQTIIRPGIGWRVSKRLDLYAGYARIDTHRPGPDGAEDRLWQQASYGIAKVAGGTLSGRTRLEQRMIKGQDETGWRLRQFVRYGLPVKGPMSLVLQDEVFLGFNRTPAQASGFGQNRAFAGFAWQFTPKLRSEAGYLNQYIRNQGTTPDRTNHHLSVQLIVAL